MLCMWLIYTTWSGYCRHGKGLCGVTAELVQDLSSSFVLERDLHTVTHETLPDSVCEISR
jgi:hypothetical protein